jgi:hypothetical protein
MSDLARLAPKQNTTWIQLLNRFEQASIILQVVFCFGASRARSDIHKPRHSSWFMYVGPRPAGTKAEHHLQNYRRLLESVQQSL